MSTSPPPGSTSEARGSKSMAIEVKGGKNVNIADLRGLRGVLERDEAKACRPDHHGNRSAM